jgi:3-isopropylmalate/(R)-2-methylmalate dehydratase small subunit
MSAHAWKFGDSVDTDAMAPGLYMKLPIEELAKHCLEGVRPEFALGVRKGDIVIAGRNFGIGSSREQAAQALKALGVHAVIAQSFGGIFYRNALNLGLVVLVCARTDAIADGARIEVDPIAGRITLPGEGVSLACEPVPAFLLEMVQDGGLLPHLKKRLAREAQEKREAQQKEST